MIKSVAVQRSSFLQIGGRDGAVLRYRTDSARRFIFWGMVFIGRCTTGPSIKEVSKLDEQRSATESAEKKLADLRLERMKLEHVLQEKQAQLQQGKSELQNTTQKGQRVPRLASSRVHGQSIPPKLRAWLRPKPTNRCRSRIPRRMDQGKLIISMILPL